MGLPREKQRASRGKRAKKLRTGCQLLATTVLGVHAELKGVHSQPVWTLSSRSGTQSSLTTARLWQSLMVWETAKSQSTSLPSP